MERSLLIQASAGIIGAHSLKCRAIFVAAKKRGPLAGYLTRDGRVAQVPWPSRRCIVAPCNREHAGRRQDSQAKYQVHRAQAVMDIRQQAECSSRVIHSVDNTIVQRAWQLMIGEKQLRCGNTYGRGFLLPHNGSQFQEDSTTTSVNSTAAGRPTAALRAERGFSR